MKTIKPPVKIDVNGRVITKGAAHKWRLNVPASLNAGRKLRLFFDSESAASAKRTLLLENKEGLSAGQKAALDARGMTVEDAIKYAITHAPLVTTLTLGTLLDLYVQHRSTELRVGERYLATLASYIKKIKAKLGEKKLQDVSTQAIREFLAGLKDRTGKGPASPDSRNHYLETFCAVFNYAKAERLISTSPTDPISQMATEDGNIETLSVEQSAKLLNALAMPEHAEVAPAALLQLFAAPRRSELMLISWEAITAKYLRLDDVKKHTKKRPVEMPETLLEWLAVHRKATGWVFAPDDLDLDREALKVPAKDRPKAIKKAIQAAENAYAWRLERAAKSAGITLSKNVLRHTAITMRVNITGDIAATSLWAGNSPDVIQAHYLGKATKDDAERFYGLKPTLGTVIGMTPQLSPEAVAVGPVGAAEAVG